MLPLPTIAAWAPRATASGSIDPLGALRPYTALATSLLPGVTTVTTRVRYLSWICAGLSLLDASRLAPSTGTASRIRRRRILVWERLVALATVLHAADRSLSFDHPGWSELRGISYVKTAVTANKRGPDFPMLKNQSGVGGVGTYWVTLVAGGLVDADSAALSTRGEKLAKAFLKGGTVPAQSDLIKVFDNPKTRFNRSTLTAWGATASLDPSAIKRTERRLLTDALLEPRQHRKLASALDNTEFQASAKGFKALARTLRKQGDRTSKELSGILLVLIAFEAIHLALLNRFDRLRLLNATGARVSISRAATAVGTTVNLSSLGTDLRNALTKHAKTIPDHVSRAVQRFLTAATPALEAENNTQLVHALIHLHEDVQSGKTDASRLPKRPWIERQGQHLVIAPRFALDELQARAIGSFTHPYRIHQFQKLLLEAQGTP